MAQQVIGRPVRVPTREVWTGGSQELVTWLLEHPSAINDALDLELSTVTRGRRGAAIAPDLLAEDPGGGLCVLEVALGRAGNTGLGRLVTYVSALQAEMAVWIVEEIAAEHVAAMNWLNRSGIARFYLLQLQCFKGPEGTITHLITRVLGPSPLVRSAESERRRMVERSDLRLAFFDRLCSQANAPVMVSPRRGMTSVTHRLTRLAGVTYNFVADAAECGAEVRIAGVGERQREALVIYQVLFKQRDAIEAALHPDVLVWESLGSGHYRIASMIAGGYDAPESDWDEIQIQLMDVMARLRSVMKKYLHKL
ncbi:DUF4268 domain-containing protein [Ferrimicrobium sp.]|uniref:DUF4268 domain-containing protein n=1 Tax=Ferrimicrobium sp. TaxID=2926050 RepID=UPI002613A0E9|nr:DUF4268 domain-containing protein [Ferrimicrobium sp.]